MTHRRLRRRLPTQENKAGRLTPARSLYSPSGGVKPRRDAAYRVEYLNRKSAMRPISGAPMNSWCSLLSRL